MKTRFALAFLSVLVVSGCATQPDQQDFRWHKPNASADEFHRDAGSCKAQGASIPGGSLMQLLIVYENCMAGRGWYKVPARR